MTHLQFALRLLGPFEIQQQTGNVPKLGRKTRALLAYLAATSSQHTRRNLMEMFCPEATDPAAALRWHLSRIRRQLDGDILLTPADKIKLNSGIIQCDHHEFQQIMANPAKQTVADLNHAFRQYRGRFLEKLNLPNAPTFDIWLLGERARYRQLFENGSHILISRLIQQQKYDAAIPVAQALLQTNPLLEIVQTQLIWLYAQTGQRDSALKQFAQCKTLLWQELAVTPAPDLLALHEAIVHHQPLTAVTDETAPDGSVRLSETAVSDFVGRYTEQSQLQTIWRNGGGIVLVEAVAGGGKTRLIEEFRRDLPENTVQLSGHSYESTRNIPYQPWLPILENYLASQKQDLLQKLAPRWQQQLGSLLPDLYSSPAATPNQQQLFRAITHLLTELSASQPTVVLLEDLQWADEASLQLFQFIAQQRPRRTASFLLIGTFRSEEVADNTALPTLLHDLGRVAVARMALRPLTAIEVEQMITHLWRHLPPGFNAPLMRDTLLQSAGGNPLFTSEILHELVSAAALPEILPIPPSLTALTARRLKQMPASGRQVIESLAVLDRPAHFDLAQQISARTEEETLVAIEMGLRWRLLQPDERTQVDFSHDLFRTAVIAQLSPVRRTILHRRTAQTLTQWGADAATLSHHWQQAGDKSNEAKYAALAGQEAAALFANEEAIHYFERVVAIQPTPAIWRQLGDVQKRIGRWDNAQSAYEQALLLTENMNVVYERASIDLSLGKLLIARGNYKPAHFHLDQAETAFRQHDCQPELADTYNNQAIIAYRQGNYETALAKYKAAVQIDQSLDDRTGMAIRFGNMGLVYLDQNKLDQAQDLLDQSLQLSRQLRNQEYIANRLGNLGIVASAKGDYDGALQLYQQAIVIDEELGNTQSVARHIGNMGIEYHRKRDYQAAVTRFFKALVIEQAMGNVRAEARLLGNCGAVYQDVGDFALAERCLALALQMDLAAGHRDAVARHSGNLALVFLRQGLWEQVERWVQPAITLMRQLHDLAHLVEYLLPAVQLALHDNRFTAAEQFLHECLSLLEQQNRPDIHLPAAILLLETQARQQTMPVTAVIKQLRTLLSDWPEAKDQAILYDAIWKLDPRQDEARDKAAQFYAAEHTRFPHVLYRQRYQILTGIELPPPPLPPPPGALPARPDLDELNRQLNDLAAAHANAHGRLLD